MGYKMEYGKELKKAMVDKNIGGAKALSNESGVSYGITLRLLASDKSVRLKDLITTTRELGITIKLINWSEGL